MIILTPGLSLGLVLFMSPLLMMGHVFLLFYFYCCVILNLEVIDEKAWHQISDPFLTSGRVSKIIVLVLISFCTSSLFPTLSFPLLYFIK